VADDRVFAGGAMKTHMPFFDGSRLVFCRAGEPVEIEVRRGGDIWRRMAENPELAARIGNPSRTSRLRYRAWKLAWCPWDDRRPRPIATGLPADAVECSPAMYFDASGCHLSFVGGVARGAGLVYHLYSMSGPSLDELGPAIRAAQTPTRIGFVGPELLCTGRGSNINLCDRQTGEEQVLTVPLAGIYRATFRADAPQQLLITGRGPEGHHLTVLYDLECDRIEEVQADGPVYKATVYGDRVVFARRGNEDFDDRQLCHGRLRRVPFAGRLERRRATPSRRPPRRRTAAVK